MRSLFDRASIVRRGRAFALGGTTVAMLLAPAAAPLAGQMDSSSRRLFTWQDAVLGSAFLVGTLAIRPLDKSAAHALQRPDRQQRRLYQKLSKFVRTVADPGAPIIGVTMYGVGRLTDNDRLAAVGLHGTEALVIGSITGTVLKDFFGRARPFVDTTGPNPDDWQLGRGWRLGDNFRSFPSGHSTTAFAAAGAVTAETSAYWPSATYFLIGPVLYGGAAAVGLSRMYNNRHWASDVIMGAAIGTFAGMKVVRYHRTHPDNRIDDWLLGANWKPGTGHVSLSLVPAVGRHAPPRRR